MQTINDHSGINMGLKWYKRNTQGLTFCQFFFKRETRKLTLIWTFWKSCFSSISRLPTATPMQRTFFNWNFTVALVSLTLDSSDSWWFTRVGNLPASNKKSDKQINPLIAISAHLQTHYNVRQILLRQHYSMAFTSNLPSRDLEHQGKIVQLYAQ